MIREILIFQFSHLLLKRIIRIQELGKMLMSYKKTQVVNHRFQMCRHRAAIFCQLLGSPERNHRSPHLTASTNHPVGGRYLAKLMKGNPWWGEEGWGEEWRRDSWRGRKARTMWERLAGWGVGSSWEVPQRKMCRTA